MSESFGSAPNLLEEAIRMAVAAVSDVVPPEAQLHLVNAQRELLLAVAVTIDHNRSRGGAGRGRGAGGDGARRPARVELD